MKSAITYQRVGMSILSITLLLVISCKGSSAQSSTASKESAIAVNPALFITTTNAVQVTKVPCTLSNGVATECYKIVTKSNPSDHEMGPWCPDNILDSAAAGGIWLNEGKVYDVDGAFIKNMATFFNDNTWKMYDDNGNIYKTKTKEECAAAANPNVGEEYENFCVECLPSYVTEITQTYLVPVTPMKVSKVASFGRGPGGPPPGGRPEGNGDRKKPAPREGHSRESSSIPSLRGIAFNGVRFDAPAPVDAILGAYTLAPFDDAGGHINLNAGYHYHAATGLSKEVAQDDGHAAMIGYAIDGHGMYAQLSKEGNKPTDLDDCRGHTDATRGYHYHVAAPGENNFINCLAGAYAMD